MVLSGFRPAVVLKGGPIQSGGSPAARTSLVVVQFAILVCLIATTATIYRQTQFALAQGLGGADNRFVVAVVAPCNGPFHDEVRKLPGVVGSACFSYAALNIPSSKQLDTVQLGGGRKTTFDSAPVGFGFFELFGVKPLAGRLFSRDRGEDGVLSAPNTAAMPTVIINETAARALGFGDPRAAIGKTLNWSRTRRDASASSGPPPAAPSQIIGVVPDMPMTVRLATDPTFYQRGPSATPIFVTMRLTGQDMKGTVRAIADTWKRTNPGQAFNELFMSQFRANLYLDLTIQSVTIAICAGLAVLIACLGLFALSAYTTERRTKEIGIQRKRRLQTPWTSCCCSCGSSASRCWWRLRSAIPLGVLADRTGGCTASSTAPRCRRGSSCWWPWRGGDRLADCVLAVLCRGQGQAWPRACVE